MAGRYRGGVRLARLLAACLVGAIGASRGEEPAIAGRVTAVSAGDECTLETGKVVRLSGVRAPHAADGLGGGPAEAAARAKSALAEWTLDRLIRLDDPRSPDRYGRTPARLRLVDPATGEPLIDVNARLVAAGHVRVDPTYGAPLAMVRELLVLERRARLARLGLWTLPAYRIRHVEETRSAEGAFTLVEGFVRSASEVRGRIFLNFGADWRTDFTVTIPPEARDAFSEAGLDPLALERRSIRVRGVVDAYNGPSIEVVHPGAIEVLG